jgi:hypothetical protein
MLCVLYRVQEQMVTSVRLASPSTLPSSPCNTSIQGISIPKNLFREGSKFLLPQISSVFITQDNNLVIINCTAIDRSTMDYKNNSGKCS